MAGESDDVYSGRAGSTSARVSSTRCRGGPAPRLPADVATAEGQQFARSYQTIAGLRHRHRPLAPVAATLPDGTPHPDPFLAARDRKTRGGVYVRRPHADLEAGWHGFIDYFVGLTRAE